MNVLKAWISFMVSGAVLSACAEDEPDDGMGDTAADTSTGESPTASATGASASATDSPDEPTSSGGAPAGTCGGQDCDWAAEYCHESQYDGPSEYECRAIPPSCAETPTCECIGPLVCDVEPFGCGANPSRPRVACVEG